MNHVDRLRIGLLFILGWLCLSVGVLAQDGESNSEGNCAITLEGQDFHVSGAIGAMDADPAKVEIPDDWIPNLIDGASLDPADLGNQKVAILIVDDFGEGSSEGDFDDADLSTMTDFPHGALVKQHTMRLLDVLQGSHPTLSGIITIKEVNIGHFETSNIVSAVQNAITELVSNDIHRFVVNMSFTLLPCATVEGFLDWERSNQSGDFESYFASLLGRDPTIVDWHNFMQEQLAQVASDGPMRQCLTQEGEGYICNPDPGNVETIVFVAAAGNFGNKFSMRLYPGAWPEVVNVSGLEFDNTAPEPWLPWFISNTGEVLAPAAWYRYFKPGDGATETIYAGTSFAAPDMSIVAAAHLTTPAPSCPFDAVPPLFANAITGRTFDDIQKLFC